MTNAQLADLLEEAARRLRAVEGFEPRRPKSSSQRETVAQFALRIGKSQYTVRTMCWRGDIIARQIGRTGLAD